MRECRLLIVDDNETLLRSLRRHYAKRAQEVVTCASSTEAITQLRRQSFDVVLTDLRMEELEDGMKVLAAARDIDSATQVILMTAFGTVANAVEAMRLGAFAYVEKPFDLSDMDVRIEKALEHRRLQRENVFLHEELEHTLGRGDMIGEHPLMRELFGMIQRVARTDSTVLILGDNGTGKELVARAIHDLSERRDGLLVPVNCAAIPGELLESELFGHVRGSFTGAHRNKVGRFEIARGGTLFLDEIGDMPVALQAKLLRVLQDGVFEPVGATRQVQLEARVVAATNQDLEEKIRQGTFREDLYYRLNVIPLRLPALKDRPDDIPLLARHFLRHFVKEQRASIEGFSPEVLGALVAYPWPGNVRELENLVERLVVLNPDRKILSLSELPSRYRGSELGPLNSEGVVFDLPESGIQIRLVLERIEDHFIDLALERTGGNRNQAARLLGLKRTTLVEKLKKRARREAKQKSEGRVATPFDALLV